jgi:hypothetical protein
VGISPALNFKATIDREVCRTYGDKGRINDVPILKNGVVAFMPNTPVEIGLGVSHTYLGPDADRAKHPARFDLTLAYDFEGRHYEELVQLEVHDLYAETMITQTEMSDLVKAVREDVGKPIKEAVRLLKPKL